VAPIQSDLLPLLLTEEIAKGGEEENDKNKGIRLYICRTSLIIYQFYRLSNGINGMLYYDYMIVLQITCAFARGRVAN
jgi:hypothetical protein